MKNRCRLFPNCTSIAKMLDISVGWLNVYIRGYNEYAKANGLEAIRSNKKYSEEELIEIKEKLEKYQKDKNDPNSQLRKTEFKALSEQFGSSSAYASYALHEAGLSGRQISDITTDIYRLFVDVLTKMSQKEVNGSFDQIVEKLGPTTIMNFIKTQMAKRGDVIAKAKLNADQYPDVRAQISDEEYEGYSYALDMVDKFLVRPSKSSDIFQQDLFYEAAVLALPMINSVLGKKINEDFVFVDNDAKNQADAENVYDQEEPTVEHWQDIIDRLCPETSISNIVKRVLMNTQKIVIKQNLKYYLDGKEIDPSQITAETRGKVVSSIEPIRVFPRTAIMGLPYTSNPSIIARSLFKILESCTDEQDMMDILVQHEEFKELYSLLDHDSRLRTTFFINFNKYNMEMTKTSSMLLSDGTYEVKNIPLDRNGNNNNIDRYISDITLKNLSNNTIYIQENNISEDKTSETGISLGRSNNIQIAYNRYSKAKDYLSDHLSKLNPDSGVNARNLCVVLQYLGIDVDYSWAQSICDSIGTLNILVDNLFDFFNNGEREFFNTAKKSSNVIKKLRASKSLKKILSIVYPFDSNSSNNRGVVDFAGNKIATRIQPSAVTNLIKKFKSYDGNRFLSWIRKSYLNSSCFIQNKNWDPTDKNSNPGIIYNRWIADMVAMSQINLGSGGFKDIFNITRNLGFNDIKFENINDRDHMLSVIFDYLSNRVIQPENTRVVIKEKDRYYSYNENTGKRGNELKESNLAGKRLIILGTPFIESFDTEKSEDGHYAHHVENRNDVATIPMFITGDTNALRSFKTIHYYEDEILEGVYNLYLSDISVQKVVDAFNKNGMVVSANGKETFTKFVNQFGILTFLNKDKWKNKLNDISTNGLADKDRFKDLVKEYLDEEFEEFISTTLSDLGVLDKTPQRKLDKKKQGKYVYFDKSIKADNKDEKLRSELRDFFFNYKFGMYNQINLLHVSTLFFNNVEDLQKRNKGQATTGTSLSPYATINGESLWDENNFAEKVVYFKDVKNTLSQNEVDKISKFIRDTFTPIIGKSETEKKLKDLLDKYKSNSLTDGQGIRTFESYRRILASAGENFWTREQESAYQKIQTIIKPARENNRNLTAAEIQSIENLMVVFQPIKPINDCIETYQVGDEMAKIGVQLKYSEIPLLPEMYPVGSKLRQIGDWMRDNKVDLICSDKCLKKGSFGEVDIQYVTKNGLYVNSKNEPLPGYDNNNKLVDAKDLKIGHQRRYIDVTGKDKRINYDGNVDFNQIIKNQSIQNEAGNETGFVYHNIPMDNYLIQNNIPDHSNGEVTAGTQIRKIVGSMIKKNVVYNINGKEIRGDKLLKMYNALHTAKFFKSYFKFINVISDPVSLTKNLAFSITQNNRNNIGTLEKIALDEDGKPRIPYSELGSGRDILNNLVSIFKRFVIRQKVAGGNIVQASALGVGEVLSDPDLHSIYNEDGIEVGVEVEMPFFFQVKAGGTLVRLKYEKYCFDDGTFKPGENGGKTLIEEHYPGILDMVIYRIPTEGAYSMCNARIKRCCPKTASNVIKRPAKLTSRFDDDFDIDKMFFSTRNYNKTVDRLDETTEGNIWKTIYSERKDIYEALKLKQKYATEKELKIISKENNVSIDDIHLNYFWEAAEIKENKQEVFNFYAEKYLSNIKFGSDKSDILKLNVESIDNAIFDITKSVLSDKSTMADRIAHGGFDEASNSARIIRCLRNYREIDAIKDIDINTEDGYKRIVSYLNNNKDIDFHENYDYSDPLTLIKYKQWNQIAGKEIGIFANDNVNDAISKALTKFSIKDKKDAILFGSLLEDDIKPNNSIDDRDEIGLNFLFETIGAREISKTLHELLGASVDAVKDNALIDLNLNEITGDAGAMLVRLGNDTLDIGLLFNQPIILDTLKYMNRSGEKNVTNALKVVMKQYGINVKYNILSKPYSKKDVAANVLATNIALNRKDKDLQLSVAQLFNKIMNVKGEVSSYVQKTRNTSANTVKVDFGEYFSRTFKAVRTMLEGFKLIDIEANDTLKDPITEDALSGWAEMDPTETAEAAKDFMDRYYDHPFQYENAVYNITKAAMFKIANIATPYRSSNYDTYRNVANEYIAPWGTNGGIINELHDFIPAISIVNKNGEFNPEARTNPENKLNKEYFLEDFIDWIFTTIGEDEEFAEAFATNPLLDALDKTHIGGPRNTLGQEILTIKTSRDDDQYIKWGYTLAWDDLMNSKNPNLRRLAHDLYLYFYYINGLNPKYNIAMEIAPVSVRESLVVDRVGDVDIFYPEIYEESYNSKPITEDEIRKDVTKFLVYHSNDNNIVKTMPFRLEQVKTEDNDYDIVAIAGDLISDVKLGLYRTEKDVVDKSKMYVRPIIKIEGGLYILDTLNNADGFDVAINNVVPSNTGGLRYRRIKANFNPNDNDIAVKGDYSSYYTERNGYIFGAFDASIISNDKIEDSDDDYRTDEEDESSDDPVAIANRIEGDNNEIVDATGRKNC